MLGEPQTPSSFANELFESEWSSSEIRASEGYARDWFRVLLNRDTPPPLIEGKHSRGRALEIFTWIHWRIFLAQRWIQEKLHILETKGGEK